MHFASARHASEAAGKRPPVPRAQRALSKPYVLLDSPSAWLRFSGFSPPVAKECSPALLRLALSNSRDSPRTRALHMSNLTRGARGIFPASRDAV